MQVTPDERPLGSRVFTAGLWASALRAASYLVGFVRAVVVARLLAPDDVGLFGITLLAIAALEVFTETGFREALIQRGETVERHLSPAWTVQILRNGVIALALLAAAPFIAAFFREPAATALVRAVAIAVVVSGFENTGVVRFERHLDFGSHFRLNTAGLLADLLVSGVAAYLLRSPWALVLGLIAHRLVRTAASYVLSPYRPRFTVDLGVIRELYGFGVWVFASRLVHFLSLKGDDILVGRLLGPFALGIYQMAFQIGEMATREFTRVVASVTFPAYSRIQSDLDRVRASFLLTLELVASIVLPIAVATIYLAEPIVLLVLGDRWIDVATVLPILVWSATVRGVVATGGGVYLALGKPRLSFQVSLLRVVVLFSLIVPFARRYGLEGVAWTVLISTVTTVPFALFYVRRLLHTSSGSMLRHLAPGAGLTAAVTVPFMAFAWAGWTEAGAPWLAAGLSVILYAVAAGALYHSRGRGPLRVLALIPASTQSDTPSKKGEAD